jgi:hypothetical protein
LFSFTGSLQKKTLQNKATTMTTIQGDRRQHFGAVKSIIVEIKKIAAC